MSYYFTTANSLLLFVIFSLVILLYPNFVVLKESPMWLIKQKRYREAVKVLREIAQINGRGLPDLYFQTFHKALVEGKVISTNKAEIVSDKFTLKDKLSMLFLNWHYLKAILILGSISSSLFCVYYGMITSVQDMGFKTMQNNGMFVGLTQALGFIFIIRFLPTTRRKVALLFIQAMLLIGAFLLVSLSFFEKSSMILLVEGAVSNIFISATISCQFSFLYVVNSESFPTHVRGLAVGLILLTGKLVGSFAPYINLFSKHMKVHVLVGSTLPVFFSLMATMFLKETLVSSSKGLH